MTFSINWPPMFQPRTSDKNDPCYVGRLGDPRPKTSGAPPAWGDKVRPAKPQPGYRLKVGTVRWKIYRLVRDVGPHLTVDIATALDISVQQVTKEIRMLVVTRALVATKQGRQLLYSMGAGAVVEVGA